MGSVTQIATGAVLITTLHVVAVDGIAYLAVLRWFRTVYSDALVLKGSGGSYIAMLLVDDAETIVVGLPHLSGIEHQWRSGNVELYNDVIAFRSTPWGMSPWKRVPFLMMPNAERAARRPIACWPRASM